MDEYHITAHELLGPRLLVQSEEEYVAKIRSIATALYHHYKGGKLDGAAEMKGRAAEVVSGCLDRDPTLQKVANAIFDL